MAEPQDKPQEPAPLPESPAAQELPLDTRILSEAVIELNISRKNVSIYPPGHAQITKSIDRAYDVLLKLFAVRDEMTLGVAKDTLFVGQDYLDQRNPVFRDFALSLSAQGVAAVSFKSGLDLGELERFHRIITTKPEDVLASGGIAKVVATMDVPHVIVTPIDYDSFHLTEEEEIFKAEAKPEKPGGGSGEAGGSMWMDFVSLMSAGTLARGEEGVSISDTSQIDPAELAKLLNERKLDAHAATETYDHIISSHVRRRAERSLSKEQSETLKNLNSMLRELHPDLRKQFLSSAFKNVSTAGESQGAEEVLGGMGDDMIIEMLRQASSEGREISPTLTGLLSKLATVRDRTKKPSGGPAPQQPPRSPAPTSVPGGPPGTASAPTVSNGPVQDMDRGQMEGLLDREKYEQYVGADYDRMLKDVGGKAGAMKASGKVAFPIEEFLPTMEDEHLDFQIGRALIAFMEEKIDAEDYEEFAKKLAVTVPDLLKSGNFALLLDILQTLRWHLSDKKEPGILASVADVLKVFWEPEFIAKAIEAYDTWWRTKGMVATQFLHALGSATVPGLLDLYAQDESPGGRRSVFDLLAKFGEPTVAEALKRLQDPRPPVVRNLLTLIRRTATKAEVVVSVRPLTQHKDPRVRLEALAVMLRFKEPAAVTMLRQSIQSSDPDVAFPAIALAAQYRVREVGEQIIALIKHVVLFESDYKVNEELIKALGELGDARAIPELEKLAKGGLPLYRESQARMKRTLYATLDRYPRESIAGLLRIGERSGDETIRRFCRKLAEKTSEGL